MEKPDRRNAEVPLCFVALRQEGRMRQARYLRRRERCATPLSHEQAQTPLRGTSDGAG